MRIVKKQQGGAVNNTPRRNPRYVVGHPGLAGSNPTQTYNTLDSTFNTYPSEGSVKVGDDSTLERRYAPNSNNRRYIDRQITQSPDGWAPADTVYTEGAYVVDPWEERTLNGVIQQAGVVHSNNYDGSKWHYRKNMSFAAPKIINGEPHYYDTGTGKYIPAFQLAQ